MLMILSALIVAASVGTALLYFSSCRYDKRSEAAQSAGFVITIAAACGALVYFVMAFQWFAAGHKATIVNREFATQYTAAEIFWAGDAIDSLRELGRQRIEINGDLMAATGACQ